MSVHPRFAEAIMDGRKKVEFRKRPLADDVTVVWVYATTPIQRIIGYFEIDAVHAAKPADLWRQFAAVGCIDRVDFDRYYAGATTGAGIAIRKAVRLDVPAPIADLLPSGVPPQSYAYVGSTRNALAALVHPMFQEIDFDVAASPAG
ncbi:ASCH domain-containing protein [Mycolicibacterium xanthum]|uniref:ASCH domain-containing protein n=1 Tax=Mycolicibacterium xanthum TaxID=2796469 RepID=UPI002103A063|nr:ASCH domain-containing protein [Mycolicibacterium xanthum]